MKTHDLKTWPAFFAAMADGSKTFELRWNDRDYQVGDILHLREWDPQTEQYSGQETVRRVTYMLAHRHGAGCAADFGLKDGYVILNLEQVSLKSAERGEVKP